MHFNMKLKPNEKAYILILVFLVALVAVIYAGKNIGHGAAIGIWGLLVFLNAPLSLGEYLKTKNNGFLFAFIFQMSASLFAVLIIIYDFNLNPWITWFFIMMMVIFGALGLYYNFSRRTKWRYREILELASMPVNDISNGFTGRPKPVTKINISEKDLRSFGNYLLKNLIAIPYYETDRVVFSFAMTLRHRIGVRHNYKEFSHVIFEYNGKVSAHISRGDYQKYRDQLAFDQLCDSLGNLFIDFFQLYVSGEAVRINDRLNTLKLSPLADFGESSV